MAEPQEKQAEIAARVEAATPAPWHFAQGTLKCWVRSEDDNLRLSLQMLDYDDGHEVSACENALFIAHSREDVPWLLKRIALLEAALNVARQKHAEGGTYWFSCPASGRDADAGSSRCTCGADAHNAAIDAALAAVPGEGE